MMEVRYQSASIGHKGKRKLRCNVRIITGNFSRLSRYKIKSIVEEESEINTSRRQKGKKKKKKKSKKGSKKNRLSKTMKEPCRKKSHKHYTMQKTFDHFAPLPGVTFIENGKVKKGDKRNVIDFESF